MDVPCEGQPVAFGLAAAAPDFQSLASTENILEDLLGIQSEHCISVSGAVFGDVAAGACLHNILGLEAIALSNYAGP